MREERPPTKDEPEPETQTRALAIAAMAGVAVGALGLAAWVRSRKRSASSARKARQAAGFSGEPAAAAPPQEPSESAVVMPAGVEGEVRIEDDRVIVVGPLGAGARARVYERADWDSAINGSGAQPLQPSYEISRPSPHAAWLAAMDHIRAQAKEGEVS